ncbi:MAG: hypothetical protein ABI353_24205 [Isosphaeraceae bacterium]
MISNIDLSGKPKRIYLTNRLYRTAARAKSHLQLPSEPVYRIEVDSLDVPMLSPLVRIDPGDNPQWGLGKGTEFQSPGPIRVDARLLTPLTRRKRGNR